MPIACVMIFGENPEPFLEAALRSVAWVDYYAIVNTGSGGPAAGENERTVRAAVPSAKLRYAGYESAQFSFADARNLALGLVEPGDFVLLVDADDVHYPQWEAIVRRHVHEGADSISAKFWHLMVYKDLYQGVMPREIVFRRYEGTCFDGRVHERLVTPRHRAVEADYHYVHYGYIKPQGDIFRRWQQYAELEADPGRYDDGTSREHILDDRIALCRRLPVEHPPAAAELLAAYPSYFDPATPA